MPLQPLSKIPLGFLPDSSVEYGDGPYDVLPWTNASYRHLCGLRPLREEDNDEIEDGEESDAQFVDISDGFILTDEATKSMNEKDRKFFTPEARQKITQFLIEVRRHTEQLRQAQAKPKKKKGKRRGKKTSAATSDSSSDEDSFVNRVENISGWSEFKGACLAMQNRASGVIVETVKIMKDMDRTPMTAWRTYIYTSQRQDDINAKKAELKLHNPPGIGKFMDDRLVARVARMLFGAEAFMESSEILWGCYDRATKRTIRRAWEREMHSARKTLKKAAKEKKAYQDALKEARDSPCPRLLHKASKHLKMWKSLAEITGESTEVSYTMSSGDLEALWEDLGFSSDPAEQSGKPKGRRAGKLLRALATQEQMEAAYANYREQHFCEMDGAMDEMTEALQRLQDSSSSNSDSADTAAIDLLQGTEAGDLGVEEFAQTPVDELLRLMGLLKARKLPMTSDFLKVLWHQLVAIVIILTRLFTHNLGDPPIPTLLCDDVGLGKTAQILGIICMLVHCYELQQANKPLPPLLMESKRLHFAGQEKIPQLPSIILVPLGLLPQWYQQFKRFTTMGGFQVIDYSAGQFDSATFFEPNGPWEKHCKGKDCHRTIIIAPISVIAAEAKKYISDLDKSAAGRDRSFKGETKTLAPDIPTLLNKKFLFFACDEIHSLRNLSWAQLGAQQVASNSMARMGATATPIFHAARDLLAIGRILRLLTMIGAAGLELGKNMLKSEQTRRRKWKRDERGDSEGGAAQSTDQAEEVSNPQDEFLARRLATANANKHRTFFIHSEAIDMAKKELFPILIRRTGSSKDPGGKSILDLQHYYESIAWSPQREHEMEAVQSLMKALLDCQSEGDSKEMQIIWRNFLLDHKKTLFHWLLEKWKPDEPPFWMNWTVESLQVDASSKILTTIALVQHYQQANARPLFFNADGTRDLTKEAECDCKPADKPRKVVIFVMYIIHRKIMKRALSLVGLESVEYDGRMSPEMRDEALKQFESDENIRVLLMSNVGTTGLNLTMASVIIFLSGLWSGMEIKQTIGRVWRAGQLLSVIVHHIFAPGTADVMLAALAGDKVLMLDHLYEARTFADKIFNTHSGQDDSDIDWQGEDEAPSGSSSRVVRSKAAARPRKAVQQQARPSSSATKPATQSIPSKEGPGEQEKEDSSGKAGISKPLAPPKRRLSQTMAGENDGDGEKGLGNSLELQSQPEKGDARLPKRARTSSTVNDAQATPAQLTMTPVVPPPAASRPPTPIQLPSQTQSQASMRTVSPTPPHIASSLPPSRGSSPVHTQQEPSISMAAHAVNSATIAGPKQAMSVRLVLSPSSSPSPPPALKAFPLLPLQGSSEGSSQDPRFVAPPIQFPGQFKRKKPPTNTTSTRKPKTRHTGAMRSPSPTSYRSTGIVLRESPSPSPPPNSKGNLKGKGKA